MKLRLINKFAYFITLIFGIILFQSLAFLEFRCKSVSETDKINYSICKNLKRSRLTDPSKFLLSASSELKLLLQKKSSSGMVVDELSETQKRFKNIQSGFTFYYPKDIRKNAGFILLSFGDPIKDGEPSIELWDLNKQKLVHKWNFDLKKILFDADFKVKKYNSVVFASPLLLDDGSIITIVRGNDNPSALIKISLDGKLLKVNKNFGFHHSIDIDSQGKIYVPIEKNFNPIKGYKEEGFSILDENLNIIKTYFLSDIFKDSKLDYKIYSNNNTDPFHLNDVAPLRKKIKTDVVLLSLRSLSAILAFSLEDENIIWFLEGYTNRQHDIDILNKEGTEISIFDNNVSEGKYSDGNIFTRIKNLPSLKDPGNLPMIIYNFPSKHQKEKNLILVQEEFKFLNNPIIPKTITAGASEYISKNNSIFIEESNFGRLLEVDAELNNILWQYINKRDYDDVYYMMSWSSRLEKIPDVLKMMRSYNRYVF